MEAVKGFNKSFKIAKNMLGGEPKVIVNLNEKLIEKIIFEELNVFVGIGKNEIIKGAKLRISRSDIEVELQKQI